MYIRMTTVEGITDADKTAALLGDNVVPALREQKGFVGLNASLNRETGTFGAISVWQSQADLEASATTAEVQRNDVTAALGGRLTAVRSYELVVQDIASTPPGPGSVVTIVRGRMDPAGIDGNIEFFKANVMTAARQAKGYQALRNMVDRATGELVVSFVFADRSSAEAWITDSAGRRGDAQNRGVELGTPEIRDVIYAS